MDLVVEDGSRVQVVYFLMSEDNVKRQIALPWVSFGSDASAMAAEGVFLKTSTHPRAYGNFARLLGNRVRLPDPIAGRRVVRHDAAAEAAAGIRRLGRRRFFDRRDRHIEPAFVERRSAGDPGEPMIVGALRTRPGPAFWIMVIAILDIGAIWPYNASNAAVPLASAFLGRLPQTPNDFAIVKGLGFAIFLLALVPLVFGGTVYRMLEKIMTFKLVMVLGYCTIVAVFLVSFGITIS